MKEKSFIEKNGKFISQISENVLNGKLSVEQANLKMKERFQNIVISDCDENDSVIFIISGFADNCYGFTFSTKELNNTKEVYCCGELISWKKCLNNYYFWTTT